MSKQPATWDADDGPFDECLFCGCEPCDCDDIADAEFDADNEALRGTSECPGLCDPQCDWCLVSHACPDDCGGGDACPYEALRGG